MNLWEEILSRIETKVNRHSFYTWFRADDLRQPTIARRLRFASRTGSFKDWLTKHYSASSAKR